MFVVIHWRLKESSGTGEVCVQVKIEINVIPNGRLLIKCSKKFISKPLGKRATENDFRHASLKPNH